MSFVVVSLLLDRVTLIRLRSACHDHNVNLINNLASLVKCGSEVVLNPELWISTLEISHDLKSLLCGHSSANHFAVLIAISLDERVNNIRVADDVSLVANPQFIRL